MAGLSEEKTRTIRSDRYCVCRHCWLLILICANGRGDEGGDGRVSLRVRHSVCVLPRSEKRIENDGLVDPPLGFCFMVGKVESFASGFFHRFGSSVFYLFIGSLVSD